MRIVQAWGMTETSPLAAVAHPPDGIELRDRPRRWTGASKTGRVFGGVELRIVDDAGTPLPWDDEAVGEIQVRGPWITASYYLDPSPEKFDDGWLRTGDVGQVSPNGYVQITDRAKDVIKSGGEWISSVELEGLLMAHPDVLEASVVGVPDEKWGERPLACVVRHGGIRRRARRPVRVPRGQRGPVAAARAVELHRRGPEDERRQVRQEGAAGPARRGRARRRDHLGRARPPTAASLRAAARASTTIAPIATSAAATTAIHSSAPVAVSSSSSIKIPSTEPTIGSTDGEDRKRRLELAGLERGLVEQDAEDRGRRLRRTAPSS